VIFTLTDSVGSYVHDFKLVLSGGTGDKIRFSGAAGAIENNANRDYYALGDLAGTVGAGVGKFAMRMKYNDFAFYANGSVVDTENPQETVKMGQGIDLVFGSNLAHISSRLRLYGRGLTNAKLITLTT
jgi:hypothetical protein